MTEFVDVRMAKLTKVERTKLSVGNVAIIKKFDEYNILKNNKESTRDQQIRILSLFARQVGKNFKQMTQSDIETYFHNLELKPYTKEYRRLVIVKFFKWLYKDDKPPIVNNLVPNKKAYDKEIRPDMLWTDSEVKELTHSLPHPRDKALVMVLYESEARVNELLSMNVSDVEFEGDTCIIFLPDSKTKKRRVGLSFSVPYLQKWLDCHPMIKRGDKDAPLWMSLSNRNYSRRLSDVGVYHLLQFAQKNCSVDKHINPHLLRHSFASQLRKQGYPDVLHRKRMGLAKGSKTIERYTHIDDLEVHNGYLKARGLEVQTVKEEDPTILEPKKCFRCGTENPVDSKYCYKCNMILDYREVERKLDILELFNSKFMKEFTGIDTEKIMREYKHFRAETNDLSNLLDCFNGDDEISIAEVRRKLDLKDGDALNLLQYLMTGGFIEIKMDTVKLLDKEKFRNYILMQKRYLEN